MSGQTASQAQKELQNAITKVINTASVNTNKLQKTLQDTANKVEAELTKCAESTITGSLRSKLKVLRDKAKKKGPDATHCVDDADQKLNQLKEDFIKTIKTCTEQTVTETTNNIKKIMEDFKLYLGLIKEYGQKLEKCEKLPQDEKEKCLTSLVAEMAKDTLAIPAKINTEMVAMEKMVKEYIKMDNMAKIKKEIIPVVLQNAGETILKGATQCVDNNPTTT